MCMQADRNAFMVFLRGRDVAMCPVNALAELLWTRFADPACFHDLPDPLTEWEQFWNERMFAIVGSDASKAVSYDWLAKRLKEMFQQHGVHTDKLCHAFRRGMAAHLQMLG